MQTYRNEYLESADKDLNAELPVEEKQNFRKNSSSANPSSLHHELEEDLGRKEFVEQKTATVLNATSADKEGVKSVDAFTKRDFNLMLRYESSAISSAEEDLSWMEASNFKAQIPTDLLSPYEETGWTLLKDHE